MKDFLRNLSPLSCVDMGLLYRIGDYQGAINESLALQATLMTPERKEESESGDGTFDLPDYLIQKTNALAIQCIASTLLQDPDMAKACILAIADLQASEKFKLSSPQKNIYLLATESAKNAVHHASCYIKIERESDPANRGQRAKNISDLEALMHNLDPITETDSLIHFIRQLLLYYLQARANKEKANPARFALALRHCRQTRLDRPYVLQGTCVPPKGMPVYRSESEADRAAADDSYEIGIWIVWFYLLLAEREPDRSMQQTFADQALEELHEICDTLSDCGEASLQKKPKDQNSMQEFVHASFQKVASPHAENNKTENWLSIAISGARIAFWKGWTGLARNTGNALDYLLQGKSQQVKDLLHSCDSRDEEEEKLSLVRAEALASIEAMTEAPRPGPSARHAAKKKTPQGKTQG